MSGVGLAYAVLFAACTGMNGGGALPPSSLAVRDGAGWREWWRSAAAPSQFRPDSRALGDAMRWRPGAAGSAWGELELTGTGEAWRTRLIVVRIDPRAVRLTLDTAFTAGSAAWSLANARAANVVAVNAGQFVRTLPWGWVVLDGRQWLRPSIAPLVSTVTVSGTGAVRMTHAALPDSSGVRWAFQSYPTLVNAGVVPEALRFADCGINVAHRDARLALGVDDDGRMLIVMTRFDAMGEALGRVPFGVTTPEMAAVMGSLGATDAVLLDGGISAQLLLRDAAGRTHQWPGSRKVPLALVATPR